MVPGEASHCITKAPRDRNLHDLNGFGYQQEYQHVFLWLESDRCWAHNCLPEAGSRNLARVRTDVCSRVDFFDDLMRRLVCGYLPSCGLDASPDYPHNGGRARDVRCSGRGSLGSKVDTPDTLVQQALMDTRVHGQIAKLLNDLAHEKCGQLRRELARLPTRSAFGQHVSAQAKDAAVSALERTASEAADVAVSRVLQISKTGSAISLVRRTVDALLLQLVEVVETWYRRELGSSSVTMLDASRIEAMRLRVERQLIAILPAFEDVTKSREPSTPVGRRPKFDWHGAINAFWGQVYRGDIDPLNQSQADIERFLHDHFGDQGKTVSESSVRDCARGIFEEVNREA